MKKNPVEDPAKWSHEENIRQTDTYLDDLYSDQMFQPSYWSPWHSFVIFYRQNGEVNIWQKIGHIDSGVEIFDHSGDTEVKFELLEGQSATSAQKAV